MFYLAVPVTFQVKERYPRCSLQVEIKLKKVGSNNY